MQFTIVKAVPRRTSGALRATSVENSGESAMTTMPQKKRKRISAVSEVPPRNNGEDKQHKKDSNRESVAIVFGLNFCESNPLITQAIEPDAIIRNENNGMFNERSANLAPYSLSMIGTNAQKA